MFISKSSVLAWPPPLHAVVPKQAEVVATVGVGRSGQWGGERDSIFPLPFCKPPDRRWISMDLHPFFSGRRYRDTKGACWESRKGIASRGSLLYRLLPPPAFPTLPPYVGRPLEHHNTRTAGHPLKLSVGRVRTD